MKVLIDKYIPFIKGVLEQYADVEYLCDDEFTAARVKGADALIIRTTVRCGESLLAGSSVRFIATATIGTDHIDTEYCNSHDISVFSCPGCNAQAVCDYVEEALREWKEAGHEIRTVGVVGVGNVGSRVIKMEEGCGYKVVVNDAPKGMGVPLSELVGQCDVITVHTPLTREGDYATYHLIDEGILGRCKSGALIINAARGGVVDEKALLRSGRPYVIDCWEGEPHIDREVIGAEQCFLASYHIAGYSLKGKKRASEMCIDAIMSFLGVNSCGSGKKLVSLQAELCGVESGDSARGWLRRVSERLKRCPERFMELRKQYKFR